MTWSGRLVQPQLRKVPWSILSMNWPTSVPRIASTYLPSHNNGLVVFQNHMRIYSRLTLKPRFRIVAGFMPLQMPGALWGDGLGCARGASLGT